MAIYMDHTSEHLTVNNSSGIRDRYYDDIHEFLFKDKSWQFKNQLKQLNQDNFDPMFMFTSTPTNDLYHKVLMNRIIHTINYKILFHTYVHKFVHFLVDTHIIKDVSHIPPIDIQTDLINFTSVVDKSQHELLKRFLFKLKDQMESTGFPPYQRVLFESRFSKKARIGINEENRNPIEMLYRYIDKLDHFLSNEYFINEQNKKITKLIDYRHLGIKVLRAVLIQKCMLDEMVERKLFDQDVYQHHGRFLFYDEAKVIDKVIPLNNKLMSAIQLEKEHSIHYFHQEILKVIAYTQGRQNVQL